MRTNIFYKTVIILLVLLNGCTLAWLWLRPGGPEQERGGKKIDHLIISRLHLDEQQQQQFDVLKREHHSQMLEIQKESGELHHELFALLKNGTPDSAANILLTQLAANDRKKETVTFEHFRKLRGILHKDQEGDFDDLAEELGRQLMGPPDRPPHP